MTVPARLSLPLSAATISATIHLLIVLSIAWQLAPSAQRREPLPRAVEVTFERPPEPLPPPSLAEFVTNDPPSFDAQPPPPAPPGPDIAEVVPLADQPPPLAEREFPRPVAVSEAAPRSAPTRPQAPPTPAPPRPRQDYLMQIVRKLSAEFVASSRLPVQSGLVMTQVTVAQDGRLIGASVLRSSGSPELDRATMEAIRKASPFAPLPAEIQQTSYTLTVPVRFGPAN